MLVAILCVHLISGSDVANTGVWRIYGANAIILHTQQLLTPLTYGICLRYALFEIVSSRTIQKEPALATMGP